MRFSVLLSASIFSIVYITAAAQSRELFFHRILFPKSSWRKSKTSKSSTTKQIPEREEVKADNDRRPDDIYNSRHHFGVAVPVNHLTDSWYS